MTLRLTKKFAFEMAHALDGYEGKCAHLHGHSYHLEVTVEGTDTDNGIMLDFHTLKQLVQHEVLDRYDHALVLKRGSDLEERCAAMGNLVALPFNPTTENLLLHFAELLNPCMPAGTRLCSLRLAETDTSVAELLL